jgi:L-amino acid N-acyltransferase YncA
MDHLALELDDCHRCMLVGVKFHEREASISLHTDFGKVADGLE